MASASESCFPDRDYIPTYDGMDVHFELLAGEDLCSRFSRKDAGDFSVRKDIYEAHERFGILLFEDRLTVESFKLLESQRKKKFGYSLFDKILLEPVFEALGESLGRPIRRILDLLIKNYVLALLMLEGYGRDNTIPGDHGLESELPMLVLPEKMRAILAVQSSAWLKVLKYLRQQSPQLFTCNLLRNSEIPTSVYIQQAMLDPKLTVGVTFLVQQYSSNNHSVFLARDNKVDSSVVELPSYRILEEAGLLDDLFHYDCGLDLTGLQPISKQDQVESACFRDGLKSVMSLDQNPTGLGAHYVGRGNKKNCYFIGASWEVFAPGSLAQAKSYKGNSSRLISHFRGRFVDESGDAVLAREFVCDDINVLNSGISTSPIQFNKKSCHLVP
jgi:hypothetical protein